MLLVALSILPCVVMLIYRHPLLLLYMWPVMILVDVIFSKSNFGVAGLAQSHIWIVPIDSVYFFTILYLGLYASFNPRRFVSLLKENLFLSLFLAVVALYVVIYTPAYGKTAIGEARKLYFMFLFPLLALIVIKTPEVLRRFVEVVILSSAVVGVLAVALAGTQGSIIRVVNAESTLIIGLAAFAILIHRFHRIVLFHPILDRLLLFLFAALAIGSGQRSAWLAVGLGLFLFLLLYANRASLRFKIGVVAVAFLIALGTSFVYFPEVGVRLGARFAGIVDPFSDGTASWRIEGWRYQLERLEKSGKFLFGEGFGGYSWWEFKGTTVMVSPHNAYVQMALKLGLFGLAIYGLLAFDFFRRAWVCRKRLPPGPMRAYLDVGILNFGAGHAYMLGYGTVLVIVVFFAVAVCAIRLSENFHKVKTRSPVRAGRLRGIAWQPNAPAPHVPVTRYER